MEDSMVREKSTPLMGFTLLVDSNKELLYAIMDSLY